MVAVLAERYFGLQLGRRPWTGVIVTAIGLTLIAITGGSHTSALRHYSLAALIAVECGVFALGAALIRVPMRSSIALATEGLMLGVAAGVVFGARDRGRGIHARTSPNRQGDGRLAAALSAWCFEVARHPR